MKKLKWKGKVKKWKWRRNNASEKGRWNKIVKLKGCYSKVSVEVKPGKLHGSLAFCRSRLSKLVQGCLTDWTSLTRFCQHFLDGLVRPCWHYQTHLEFGIPPETLSLLPAPWNPPECATPGEKLIRLVLVKSGSSTHSWEPDWCHPPLLASCSDPHSAPAALVQCHVTLQTCVLINYF